MKIGIYTPYLDNLTGGEKYMLTLATCLASLHEVHIFWDKTQEKNIRENALSKLNIDLSSVKFSENIFQTNYSFLSRYNLSREYDAIIFLSDGSIPLVASRLFVHFQFPVEWVKPSVITRLKIKRIEKIFCNSSFTKTYVDKTFGVKSTVIYPPVPTYIKSKVEKTNTILHVGRFGIDKEGSNYKKQDKMIEAFVELVKKGLGQWEFILAIAARQEDTEKLKVLQETAKGYPIKFIINPSNNELWNLYEKAKIYWHASGFGEDLEKHPEKAEHFGITTVEAMSAGCIPVVINKGGQKEIVIDGENGFLWNTLDELQERTMTLIKNNTLVKRMSKNSVKRSEIFSEKLFCKNVNSIIK